MQHGAKIFKDSTSIHQFNDGIDKNHEGIQLMQQKKHPQAEAAFKQSIQHKIKQFGQDSVNFCISVSGLADNYLQWGKLEEAYTSASLMLQVGQKIKDREQIRIANEILQDIYKEGYNPEKQNDQSKNKKSEEQKPSVVPQKKEQTQQQQQLKTDPITEIKQSVDQNSKELLVQKEEQLQKKSALQCHNCGILHTEKKLMLCDRCKQGYYCSSECQKKDWVNHKKTCSQKTVYDTQEKDKINQN